MSDSVSHTQRKTLPRLLGSFDMINTCFSHPSIENNVINIERVKINNTVINNVNRLKKDIKKGLVHI